MQLEKAYRVSAKDTFKMQFTVPIVNNLEKQLTTMQSNFRTAQIQSLEQ